MKEALDIRPSPIAGQWYPGNAKQLAEQVDHYISQARLPEIEGEVIAVMAPHAGHTYSGPVAGHAFAALQDRSPEIVAVLSPMHQPYREPLLTSAHEAYQTPLGEILIDQEAIEALDTHLRSSSAYGLARVAYDAEHSLEIELPFLQRVLAAPFRLLPVMVRDQSEQAAHNLGLALSKSLAGRRCILVASTDLSHFYSQSMANALDHEVLRLVEAFDPPGIIRMEALGRGFACGRGALASVLWAARGLGANRAQILHYATSGDVTGDYNRVVGYGAAAITRTPIVS